MKKLLGIAVLSTISLPVFAQDVFTSPGIEQRQANQERRIEQGVRDGFITRAEAARLERGQERIRQMERDALANGRFTPYERAEIQSELERQSRRIAELTRDRDYSYYEYRY